MSLAGVLIGQMSFGFAEGAHVHIHAYAGLRQIDDHQADDQGHSGEHHEVGQRDAAGFAHRLHVRHAGNARNNGTEDQGGDDHFDEIDKTPAQRLHLNGDIGVKMSE